MGVAVLLITFKGRVSTKSYEGSIDVSLPSQLDRVFDPRPLSNLEHCGGLTFRYFTLLIIVSLARSRGRVEDRPWEHLTRLPNPAEIETVCPNSTRLMIGHLFLNNWLVPRPRIFPAVNPLSSEVTTN